MKRPSPSMVVAVLALLVAVVGTAVAAPTAIRSALNKSEKKQVRNIAKGQANQQIGKLAPGLSVANANTANSANSANSANTVPSGAIGTGQMSSDIPAASAYTTAQTITSGSHATLALNSENYDTANMHDDVFDNTRITAPVDGIYAANALVEWEADTSGVRLLRIAVNGTDPITTVNQLPVTAATSQSVTAFVALAAGEYVEAEVFQDSGGPLDLSPPGGGSLQLTWQAPG